MIVKDKLKRAIEDAVAEVGLAATQSLVQVALLEVLREAAEALAKERDVRKAAGL